MAEQQAPTVKQYSIRLQTERLTCNMEGADLGLLIENVHRLLLGSPPRFDNPIAAGGPTLIFHSSFDNGRTPIGAINAYDLPEHMSIRAWENGVVARSKAA